MSNAREWLEEFIDIYHSEPCLWKIKTKDYHDRGKKDAAYEKLLAKLREMEPTSDKESVIKKNNNLRCAYRKEHKKVTDSTKSGSGTDDIYEPKLWYYSLMRFLDEQNTPLQSRSNLDEEITSPESVSSAGNNSSVQESAWQEVQSDEGTNASAQSNQDATPSTEDTSSSSSRKRNSEATLTKDVLVTVKDHFKRPAPSPPPPMRSDDRFDIFGKAVALKLRDLNKTQRILAEKIINETLAAAELSSLTTSHTVMAPISNSSFQQYLSNQPYASTSSHPIHNTSPYSNQQNPIMIQSPTSNRPIHKTSPYSNQQSAMMRQSSMNEQPLSRNHSQTSPVVALSIPENPEILDNATFIDNDVSNQPSATIQSQVHQQHANSAADYISNYDASLYQIKFLK